MKILFDRVAFITSSLISCCRAYAEKNISFRAVKLSCGIFLYFTIGCIVYNYFEGWDIITALNFSFVTISTVGYGYESPTSDNSRIFTIFYMLFGIYFIFCTISELLTKRFDALIEYAKKTSIVGTDEVGSSLRRNRLILLALIVAQIVVVIIGALIFKYLEPDWSLAASIYFAIETSTVSVNHVSKLYSCSCYPIYDNVHGNKIIRFLDVSALFLNYSSLLRIYVFVLEIILLPLVSPYLRLWVLEIFHSMQTTYKK